METFIEAKEFTKNPNYKEQREKNLVRAHRWDD